MSFVKVVIVGDSGVGKTSLIQQYVNRRFAQDFRPTVGTDFFSKPVPLGGADGVVTLQLWDTAGQERFRSLCSTFYKGGEALVAVFDLTNPESFSHIAEWVSEFRRVCALDETEPFPMFVVGNKSDMEEDRRVQRVAAQRLCDENGWVYAEASAKLGDGVDGLFRQAAQAACERRRQRKTADDAAGAGGGMRARIGPKASGGAAAPSSGATDGKKCDC
jgi:Ras-related protein Rab-7A